MKVYTVRLDAEFPSKSTGKELSRVVALYRGPTYVRVKADTAEYAVVKAQAMLPWAIARTFSATEMLPGDII
jgi:hypothetical protein